MMRASLLDLLDTLLRQLKTRLNKVFGGIHIVFSGDFFQLPPVGASLITSEKKDEQLSALRGQELWRTCLSDAIILDENLRQSDSEWAQSLLRWRINQPTAADISSVNKRFIDKNNGTDGILQGTLIAVCDNESREKALRFCERETLRKNPLLVSETTNWRSHGVLLIQAKIKKVEGHQDIQQKHEDYVRNLSSKRLKGAGNLFCIKDAPYMVTCNQNVRKGVANGTIGTLIDVILHDNTVVRVANISGNFVYAVFADEVQCLVSKHCLPAWKKDISFPSLPEGCFPLAFKTKKTIVPLGKNDNKFAVTTTLFPCEIATVLIGHQMQGQTVQSIILGNLSARHKFGRTGWIYVVLSRVTSLGGLHLMTRLEEKPPKFKIRTEVREEMKRLKRLEKATIKRLKNIKT